MIAVKLLAKEVGILSSCKSLGVPRATYYRVHAKTTQSKTLKNRVIKPPLALTEVEKETIIALMHSERFVDKSPHEIYAILLDEGEHYCSIRTMYRYLHELGEVGERRKNHRKRNEIKPELLAVKPNEVWSWDITKLKGPQKWTYFYLYVIIDIFSRYVVGWVVSERETSSLARDFIEQTYEKQNIKPEQLTLHADRGASMKSNLVAHLLSDLGVTKTHNRPYVSNDNPYSEAQFKTLKYCPQFPEKFGSIQDARAFCRTFFRWYNSEHRHTGIASFTPEMVHYGQHVEMQKIREETLLSAFKRHPARFKNKQPRPGKLAEAVYINKPELVKIREEVLATN